MKNRIMQLLMLMASSQAIATPIYLDGTSSFAMNSLLNAGNSTGQFGINSALETGKTIGDYTVNSAQATFWFDDDSNDITYAAGNTRFVSSHVHAGREYEYFYEVVNTQKNAAERATVTIGDSSKSGRTAYYDNGKSQYNFTRTMTDIGCTGFDFFGNCLGDTIWENINTTYYNHESGYRGGFGITFDVLSDGLESLGEDGILDFGISVFGDLTLKHALFTAELDLIPVIIPEPPVIIPEPPVIIPEPPVITPEPPVITPEPPVAVTAPATILLMGFGMLGIRYRRVRAMAVTR
jgi:hypothetical protein